MCGGVSRAEKRFGRLLLQITGTFKYYQRRKVDGIEGLCMVLKRCAYPCRYSDMVPRNGLIGNLYGPVGR